MQTNGLTFFAGVLAIWVESAGECATIFFNRFGQCAFHNAQPIAVGQDFVLSIDHGDGIFQIQNGRQGGFHHQVANTSGVRCANGGVAVDLNVQMQSVVFQQNRSRMRGRSLIANELRRFC